MPKVCRIDKIEDLSQSQIPSTRVLKKHWRLAILGRRLPELGKACWGMVSQWLGFLVLQTEKIPGDHAAY